MKKLAAVLAAAMTVLAQPSAAQDLMQGYITTQIAPANQSTFDDKLFLNSHQVSDISATTVGFTGVRTDLYWDMTETGTQGHYDWTYIDNIYNQYTAAGLRVHWVVGYGNPLYASPSNPQGLPIDAATRTAFKNFLVAAVQHLGPGGRYELINEWQDVFGWDPAGAALEAALVQLVAPAVHAVDPSAIVLLGAPGGYINTESEDYLLTALGNNLYTANGVSLHPYQYYDGSSTNNADPEYFFNSANPKSIFAWQATLAAHGMSAVPTYGTESGYDYTTLSPASKSQQANIVLRHLFAGWISGYKQWTLYDHNDAGYSWIANSTERSAIDYFISLTPGKKATGYTLADTAQAQNGQLNWLRFANATQVVYAAWVRTGTRTIPIPTGAKCYNRVGQQLTSGSVAISKSGGPVFFTMTP